MQTRSAAAAVHNQENVVINRKVKDETSPAVGASNDSVKAALSSNPEKIPVKAKGRKKHQSEAAPRVLEVSSVTSKRPRRFTASETTKEIPTRVKRQKLFQVLDSAIVPKKLPVKAKRERKSKDSVAPKVENDIPHNLSNVKLVKHTKPASVKTGETKEVSSLAAEKSLKIRKKYRLTPGVSPFPDYAMPTPEACEEVYGLLCKQHGTPTPPEVLRASSTVAGCGEVPDILDAILRTLLSQNTTFANADRALKSLIATFPTADNSPDWDLIHRIKVEDVIKSIQCGGGQVKKGTFIKAILDTVYKESFERRKQLIMEKETGKPADVSGAQHEDQNQKDMELAHAEESLLSLEYLHNLTDEEVMDELLYLPGIGVKTASCVMLFCMRRASFAVDTHVFRHSRWLGWIPPTCKSEDTAFSHLDVRIPDHLKYGIHQLFIRHGKGCLRCNAKSNPGTPGWDDTVCPIEHLVKRVGGSKEKVLKPKDDKSAPPTKKMAKLKAKKPKGKKSKKAANDTTESEEVELSDADSGDSDFET